MSSITDVHPDLAGLDPKALDRLTAWNKYLVETERLASSAVLVARHGHVGYHFACGEQRPGVPIAVDTIYRIYSMTKPIVSLALMQLFEEGKFQLTDPIKLFIPAFDKRRMTVFKSGTVQNYETEPCRRSITIKHVLTHTSGLSYGFTPASNPVDAAYRKAGLLPKGATAGKVPDRDKPDFSQGEFFDRLAAQPLLFQPGEHWFYGFNTDLCGYLVELLSGMPLQDFLSQRIFAPLKMVDTGFTVPPEKHHRFASNWMRRGATPGLGAVQPASAPRTGLKEISEATDEASYLFPKKEMFMSGGGGLASTTHDYYRFCACLLNGGTLDGERIISTATLKWMTSNHLTRRRLHSKRATVKRSRLALGLAWDSLCGSTPWRVASLVAWAITAGAGPPTPTS